MSALDNAAVEPHPSNGFELKLLIGISLLTIVCCLLLYLVPYHTIAIISIILLLAASLWRWELIVAFRVSGVVLVGFSLTHLGVSGLPTPLIFFIAALGLAGRFLLKPRVYTRSFIYRGVMLFALLIAISLFYSTDQPYGLQRLGEYGLINLLVFSIIFLAPDETAIRRLLHAICGFGLVVAAVSLIDLFIFTDSAGIRYGLMQSNPIWYARSIGLAAILLLSLAPLRDHPVRTLIRWVLLIPLLYLLAAAGSRGPTVSAAITFCIYLLWTLQGRRWPVRLAVVAAVIIAAVAIGNQFTTSALVSRVSRLEAGGIDYSSLNRLNAFALAIELFIKHPLTGIGAGGFKAFHFVRYPHNIFLEIACEYGLVGLTLLGSLIGATFKLVSRTARLVAQVPRTIPLYRSFVLILIYAFLNALVSGSIVGNNWIWLALGGLLALTATLEHQLGPAGSSTSPETRAS